MKATVICLASAKGGAGKTLITATLGSLLAQIGKRVLLIDTDAATNGLTLLYLQNVTARLSDHSMPLGLFEPDSPEPRPPGPLDRDIVELSDRLYLLPATYRFRDTEKTNVTDFADRLQLILAEARESFDIVFLDAQAGADEYARLALGSAMSDTVVIVSEYDPMSAAGVERLKALFTRDLGYQRTWILLNKLLPEFTKSFSEFLEIARYLSPIPWEADVVRAYARRSLGLDLTFGNQHTLAVMQTLKMLLPELRTDIEVWLNTRSDFLRQAIGKQIASAQDELTSIEHAERRGAEQWAQKRTLYFVAAMVLAIAAGAGVLSTLNLELSSALSILIGGLALAVSSTYPFFSRSVSTYQAPVELRFRKEALEGRLRELYLLRDLDSTQLVEQRSRIETAR